MGEGHPRSRLQRAALIGRALGNLELGTYLIRGTYIRYLLLYLL